MSLCFLSMSSNQPGHGVAKLLSSPAPRTARPTFQALSSKYLRDNLDDSRGEAPSQTLSKLPTQTGWPPRVSRKTRMHFRGLADHSSRPQPGTDAGCREAGPSLLPPLSALGRRETNPAAASATAPPGWGQQKHLFGAWRLPAPTSCWESTATKRSGSGCQGKLCSLRAGVQGRHPRAQGLPLLATGPGLRGTEAARA